MGKKSTRKRQNARLQMVERLEARQMLAADFSPMTKGVLSSMYFTGEAAYNAAGQRIQQRLGSGGGGGGEGAPNNSFSTTESEPNNNRFQANFLPLGTAPGKYDEVNVGGSLPTRFDEDFYAFDLRKGDILDVRITSSFGTLPFTILLENSRGTELIFTTGVSNPPDPPGRPPSVNPLSTDGSANLNYVIDTDGRYFVRLSDTQGLYTARFRAFRPTIEAEPIGTSQVIFLDFDGATIPSEAINIDLIAGVGGTIRIPPLRNNLAQLGLSPRDEGRVIDEIVRRFTDKVQTKIAETANNGFFPNSGIPGEFNVVVMNSKDHPDPWGLPNVSRVIVGGTQAQILGGDIGLLGIAQSVDVGNFDREESALVMVDILIASAVGDLVYAGGSSVLEGFAELTAMVAAHEAGHFLGGWHQDPTNDIFHIMDQFYDPIISSGSGVDGIFGTPDDVPVRFGEDQFSPLNPGMPISGSGIANSDNTLAFGMATGKQGATIEGLVFNDKNRNGRQDAGEPGLAGWTVFVDINGDGIRNSNEPRALTGNDGKFSLLVPSGTQTVRVQLQAGFQATNPATGSQTVTTNPNQTRTGVNFGVIQPNPTATGYKWLDLNGDGIRDPGEPPLAGVWIYLDLDGDGRMDIGEPAAKTGTDGSYSLRPPSAGTYTIREVLEPGYIMTYPASGGHVVQYDGSTPLVGFDFGNREALDWGDTPGRYPVTAARNGAVHGFVEGLRLGNFIDFENDGQPHPDALGDDRNGPVDGDGRVIDDEDGVIFIRPIVAGDTRNQLLVNVTNTTGVTAYLHGWIDFNNDGDWNDAGEQIIRNHVVRTGDNVITFTAPAGAVIGDTFARFRLSQELNTAPTGRARAGEVEDYKVAVVDKLELARDDSVSVARNSLNNVVDVLANDFRIPGETLRIVSVSQGSRGGRVVINTAADRVLYTPVNGFVGTETFTYTMRNSQGVNSTATVTADVSIVFDKPVAVDDSFDISRDAIGVPLNVLANDIEGRAGALQIASVQTPDQGGSVVIGAGNQSLRYTPARGFEGTETFTYSAVDSSGNLTSAKVTIHILPGSRADDVMEFSFNFVDASGQPLANPRVRQGDTFGVQVFVDDLRSASSQPGVFAAYLDLLYNAFIVSPLPPSASSPLNFQITFHNQFTAGRQGSAEIPGIIDDVGAFLQTTNPPDRPDPTLFATIQFRAIAAGIATFIADPADSPPFTDVLMSDSPNTPVPVRQIRFGRASLEIVPEGFEFPQAIDDSVLPPIAVNSVNNRINVLANDSRGSTNNIRIESVSTPMNGTVFINNNGTPNNTNDDFLSYTPNVGFRGKDQFTYSIRDNRGFASSATVTVSVGAQTGDVTLQLLTTNAQGQPINEIRVGETFQLRGFVQDTRGNVPAKGVFAAYQDILYNSDLATPNVSATNPLGFQVSFGQNYDAVVSGDISSKHIINEIGSVQDIENVPDDQKGPLGGDRFLQFIITLTARRTGDLTFIGDPADISPFHDTLLFEPPTVVSFENVVYTSAAIKILPANGGGGGGEGYHNFSNPHDVNGDGSVSPIDVLLVINELNQSGIRDLGSGGKGGGEGEASKKYFIDTNNDGKLTPQDALMVINRLNNRGGNGGGGGEGESSADLFAQLACGALDHLPRNSTAVLSVAGNEDVALETESAWNSMNYGPLPKSSNAMSVETEFDWLSSDNNVDDTIASLASDVLTQWKRSLK